MNYLKTNQKGIALFIALMLTLMLSIIGLGIIKSSNDEVNIAGNELNEMKAFYVAEAGLEKTTAAIEAEYETTELPPAIVPADTLMMNDIALGCSTVPLAAVTKVLAKGTLSGLTSFSLPYAIRSTAYDSSHNTTITLEENFEVASVPIFQFAVFYDQDLEIAPGPIMTLAGRVHCNSDLYLESGNRIDLTSFITAFGDVKHGRKAGSGMTVENGDVNVAGADNVLRSMRDGSGWLDANKSYWYDSAAARWGGRVQDHTFGQDKLSIPVSNPDDPHLFIDRAAAGGGNDDSYELKARFKIMDGVALYNTTGTTWINVTATLLASGALKETTFHDKREGANVTVYDLDMNIFKSSTYFPPNGIIYTADNRAGLRGTRIYNASDIGFPLTIASEIPVYTKGNINSTNKKPMAIITDALTVLSGNWSDDPAKAANADKNQRPAISTTMNFSYITGNKETGVGGAAYNGGLENLPRFLENWSTQTLTYRGSIICLWLMEKFNGNWDGSYYTPPTRDWAFDNDLTDVTLLPPGTPCVRSFIRWGWHQTNVGYDSKTMPQS